MPDTYPYSHVSTSHNLLEQALSETDGVLRLAPTWVSRSFCTPGRRLRLHPDDYFPFTAGRGGIDERWLSSAVQADNGPDTEALEGISLVVVSEGSELVPLNALVEHHGADLIGTRLWEDYGRWPIFSKFFDNHNALPLHVHQRTEHAALVNKPGKPEAYYFPPQMNNHLGEQPLSYFGLAPHVSREDFRERLERFPHGGDNRITELSVGVRVQLGTGWDIPAGVLHAPASLCTYEPQADCDVFCMCESWSNGRQVPEELLWKDVPPAEHGNYDFIVDLLDWDLNTDPLFTRNRMMVPRPTKRSLAEGGETFSENWVVYLSPAFSAKELTVWPGKAYTAIDQDAYGCIATQGRGTFNGRPIEATSLIRYGALTADEYFVSEAAARSGVRIVNTSDVEPLVILKHFGPGNLELVELDADWARSE